MATDTGFGTLHQALDAHWREIAMLETIVRRVASTLPGIEVIAIETLVDAANRLEALVPEDVLDYHCEVCGERRSHTTHDDRDENRAFSHYFERCPDGPACALRTDKPEDKYGDGVAYHAAQE